MSSSSTQCDLRIIFTDNLFCSGQFVFICEELHKNLYDGGNMSHHDNNLQLHSYDGEMCPTIIIIFTHIIVLLCLENYCDGGKAHHDNKNFTVKIIMMVRPTSS